MDVPTSLWIVLDPKSGPEFAAAWREFAHEHIKDCLDEDIHEASRWVVREYTPIAEVERLRAEAEALKADAERYRWMRDNPTHDLLPFVTDDGRWYVQFLQASGAIRERTYKTLDEAVDAARTKQGLTNTK